MAAYTQRDIDHIKQKLGAYDSEFDRSARRAIDALLGKEKTGPGLLPKQMMDQYGFNQVADPSWVAPSISDPAVVQAIQQKTSAGAAGVPLSTYETNPFVFSQGSGQWFGGDDTTKPLEQQYTDHLKSVQEGQALIADPASSGATPKVANTPSFEAWKATNPNIVGGNPEWQYMNQFYNMPLNKGDFWENVVVPGMIAAAGGAMASGGLAGVTTAEVMGGGTFAGSAAAQGGSLASIFSGAAPAAAPAATAPAASTVAPAATAPAASTVAPAAGEFSLAGTGTGIGGQSAGLGLQAGAGGTGLGAGTGVGLGTGATGVGAAATGLGEFGLGSGVSGLGLNPAAAGVGLQFPAASTEFLAANPFSLGSGTTGLGLTGTAAGATGGIWSQIMDSPIGQGLKSVVSTFAPGGPQANKVPGLENLVGGLWQYFTQKDNAGNLNNATNAAIERTDPFGPERSFYQGELRKLFTDPNYLQSTPGYQAGIQQVNRRNAKLGQMFSGQNAIDNINFGTDQQLKLSGPLLQAAGAGITPGYAGYLGQQGAQMANAANTGAQGALATAGKGLWDIFKGIV
jgi:hypothetical protein